MGMRTRFVRSRAYSIERDAGPGSGPELPFFLRALAESLVGCLSRNSPPISPQNQASQRTPNGMLAAMLQFIDPVRPPSSKGDSAIGEECIGEALMSPTNVMTY